MLCEQGFPRIYQVHEGGQERIVYRAFEGRRIANTFRFLSKLPAIDQAATLEGCELLATGKKTQ